MGVQTMPSRRLVERAVADYFDAIRAMDPDALAATFSPGGTLEGPGIPKIEGSEELRGFFERTGDLFEQLRLVEQRVFVMGEEAAVKWTGWGLAMNGREVAFDGIDLFRVSPDGKICSLRTFGDFSSVRAQLCAST